MISTMAIYTVSKEKLTFMLRLIDLIGQVLQVLVDGLEGQFLLLFLLHLPTGQLIRRGLSSAGHTLHLDSPYYLT